MPRVALDDVELEYELDGEGEPVLLVHPGIFSDWFTPLRREPALANRYRLIHYNRAGCAGSSRASGAISFSRQARQMGLILQHLRIPRAHVIGHSSSGNIVLQFALDSPQAVQSLAILEPALMNVPSVVTSRAFVGAAVQSYRDGDRRSAIDTFLRGTCGPNYRAALDRALPEGFNRYVADAATFFEQELPALQQWSFTRENAQRIEHPVLAVVGARSQEMDPIWRERQQVLLDWLPNVEPFVLADATHLLQVENPRGMAEALAGFFARHSMASAPT